MTHILGSIVTGAIAVLMIAQGSPATAAFSGFSCGWCAAIGVASAMWRKARNR